MLETFNREQFLKLWQRYYSGDRKNRERFLQDMEDSLDCYLEDHPEAAWEEVCQRFGSPEELRQEYELMRAQRRRALKICASGALIAVFFVIGVAVFGWFANCAYNQVLDGTGKATVDTYIYNENEASLPAATPDCVPNEQ